MKEITAEELQEMQQSGPDVDLINVLSDKQFRAKHLPDSYNVPVGLDNFPQVVETKAGGKNKPIVVYCASPECDASEQAAQKLEDAGFANVYDFVGGIKEWVEKGNALEGERA